MQITKSQIVNLASQGKKAAEIAEILGISTLVLGKACKQLNINLRAKPRTSIEFIDDTIQQVVATPQSAELEKIANEIAVEQELTSQPIAVSPEAIEEVEAAEGW